MRSFKQIALLLAFASTIVACNENMETIEGPKDTVPGEKAEDTFYVPGRIVVEFEDSLADQIGDALTKGGFTKTRSNEINDILDAIGAVKIERVFPDAGEMEERHRKAGLHRFFYIDYEEGLAQTKAADSFDGIKGVMSAEPEHVKISTGAVFNDPKFNEQWNMYNTGMTSLYKAGMDINVQPVWKNYTAGRKDVIVGVVDGGVDLNHPDLAAAAIPAGPDGSCSFVNDHNGYTIVPDDHGTHVAGIIGAVNNNGIGVTGIAGGNDGTGGVKILSAAIFMDDPDDESKSIGGNSAGAIVWAADHGAVICQNSWEYVYPSDEDAKRGNVSAADRAAIDYFIANAGIDKDGNQVGPMKGGVVVFAAGNSSRGYSWPAMYEPVVSVSAASSIGTAAYYSNYGEWVDICAPGGDAQLGPTILSTVVNGYGSMQGTSMACPHVSGVAALIVSYYGGEGFTNEMLKEKLLKGADHDFQYAYRLGPMLDALGSITYGTTLAPEAIEGYSFSVNSNSVKAEWKVTADPDDVTAHHYDLVVSHDKSLVENYPESKSSSSVYTGSINVGDHGVGEMMSGELGKLEFDQDYYLGIYASDYQKNYSAVSEIKSFRTKGNNAPKIEAFDSYAYPVIVPAHETVNLEYRLYDADGHIFNTVLETGSEAAKFKSGSLPDSKVLTIIGKNDKPGNYVATIRLIDEYGAESILNIPYTLLANHVPENIKAIPDIVFTNVGEEMSLPTAEYFKDADGEKLSFSVSTSTPNVAHAYEKDGQIHIVALSYGYTMVEMKATDTCGDTGSSSFQVLVRDPASGPDVEMEGDQLKIMAYYEGEVHIQVSNRSGAVIVDKKYQGHTLEPALIDFSKAAAGIYGVKASYDGRTFTRTIVKK